MLNTISNRLERTHPEIALALVPVNLEARLSAIVRALAENATGIEPDVGAQLLELAAAGIRLSPIEAKFYSLIGVIRFRLGEPAAAESAFDRALALEPTDRFGLRFKILFLVQRREFSDTAPLLETFARRWPEDWSDLDPALPSVLVDTEGLEAVSGRFVQDESLRKLLIGSLAKQEQTLSIAHSLLLDWHRLGVEGLDPLVNRITARLINAARVRDAWFLFRLTRDAGSGEQVGFVYNDEFEREPSGNVFDWQLRRQAGVDMRIVERFPDRRGSGGRRKMLAIRFLNSPIRFENVTQLVRLTPGTWEISVRYSATDLRAPKPLKLAVQCSSDRTTLATLLFDQGDVEPVSISTGFTVPVSGCFEQRLVMRNDSLTESWQNRYEGTLYIDNIKIEQAGR